VSSPVPHNQAASRLGLLVEHARRPFAPRAENPSFSIDARSLAREHRRVREHPVALPRPVVVISGWRAPGVASRLTAARLASMTSRRREDFIPVSLGRVKSLPDAARAIVAAVENAAPSNDPECTRQVDVVAISMGGFATRLAAAPRDALPPLAHALHAKRLAVGTLYTLATPHRGASLAQIVAIDACARDMRPGCDFLAALDDALECDPLRIVPYARLRDGMVGAQNAAPPGMNPLWIDGPLALAHLAITTDKRITLDIALRLRAETPIAREGAAPPRH